MTEFIVDLTNYRDTVGARVSEGRYRVVVDDAEMDKSKAGNPMINMWYRVQGGEFDGATLTDRLVLTEKSMFRIVGFMQAIGLPTPKKRLKINLNNFLGKVLEVDVEDGEPYNGRTKSEVRGYIRVAKPSTGGEEPADLDDIETTDEPEPLIGSTEVTDGTETAAVPAAEPEEVDLETLDLG